MHVVVSGMIASYGLGGVVWDYGQYLLGFERLGFDVYYLEDTGWLAYDPRVGTYGEDMTYGARFLESELERLSPSLRERWHLRAMDGSTFGMTSAAMADVMASAVAFVNVSGAALLRDEYRTAARTILIDTDPGWNHFRNFPRWDGLDGGWHGTAGWRAHDLFFTYAERIGQPGCQLPTLGVEWHPTRPPVVCDRWAPEAPGRTWTSVLTWKNFGETIEHDGRTYGTKEMEFGKIESVPLLVDQPLEIAVGGTDPPRERWGALGWSVVDPVVLSADADSYRHYLQGSRGELSVAKNVYVATGSGWFSCRSTCYLAAGRPVVVQDTGWASVIDGDSAGLLGFTDQAGAVRAINRVESDYAGHQAAARFAAEEHFAAERVLADLLDRAGVGSRR